MRTFHTLSLTLVLALSTAGCVEQPVGDAAVAPLSDAELDARYAHVIEQAQLAFPGEDVGSTERRGMWCTDLDLCCTADLTYCCYYLGGTTDEVCF